MTTPRIQSLPRLRQVVLITADLEASLASAREQLGLKSGLRDEAGMADLGFAHEVMAFGDTCLEIVQPLALDSPVGELVSRTGDSGYMAVLQVESVGDLLEEAAREDVHPVIDTDYHGSRVTQWHPKPFGTLAEFDQMVPPDSWHMAPEIFERVGSGPAGDLLACTLAVADPSGTADRWARVLGLPDAVRAQADGSYVLSLPEQELRFTAAGHGPRGLVQVEVECTDAAHAGSVVVLCGVRFVLAGGQ